MDELAGGSEVTAPSTESQVSEADTSVSDGAVAPGTGEGVQEAGATGVEGEVAPEGTDVTQQIPEGGEESQVAATPFDDAFQGYGDEERDVLLGLVAGIRDNPLEAAEQLAQLAEALKSEYSSGENPEEVTPESGEAPEGITTYEQFKDWTEKLENERAEVKAQEKRRAEAVEALDTRIDTLGYGRGEAGKPDVGRAALLLLAHDAFADHEDPIKAAHESVQGWLQSAKDGVVTKAEEALEKFAPTEPNSGAGGGTGKEGSKSLEESGNRLLGRLKGH